MTLSTFASSEQAVALLRSHLLSKSAITNIVGGRVHGTNFQDPDAISVEYPLIAIDMDGGGTVAASSYQAVNFFIYCYSRDSRGEAQRIYDKVFAELQQQLLRRDGLPIAGYCMEAVRPDYRFSERPRAFFARGMWVLRAAYRGGQT